MSDRRFGLRIRRPLWVVGSLIDGTRERSFRALGVDVSDGGMRLHVVRRLPLTPGQTLALELNLPNRAEAIWMAGAIRRHQDDDALASAIGVRIVAIADQDRRSLRDFCVGERRAQLTALVHAARAV